MIRVGTSGYYYDDWVGPVYPPGLSKRDWLSFYAGEFDSVEMNVSYYRIPTPSMAQGWVDRTPENFLFTLKAHRSITHERVKPDFEAFRAAMEPLKSAGKLACVLAQFPYSFRCSAGNREYLSLLREELIEAPVVIEFRNRDWVRDSTFTLLEELSFGYCCVDEPSLRGLMPPIAQATGPISYLRLHGRNHEKWWQHEHAWERYDYSYSQDELREWLPKIISLEGMSELTLIYANNHPHGQGVDTARTLKALLAAPE